MTDPFYLDKQKREKYIYQGATGCTKISAYLQITQKYKILQYEDNRVTQIMVIQSSNYLKWRPLRGRRPEEGGIQRSSATKPTPESEI